MTKSTGKCHVCGEAFGHVGHFHGNIFYGDGFASGFDKDASPSYVLMSQYLKDTGAKDAEIANLSAELAASQKLAAALSDEHEEVERLTTDLAAAKMTHEEFRAEVARLEDKIEALETYLAESEDSCDRLCDAYDQVRVLNVEIANAGAASCATLRDERDAARQDAERLKERLSKYEPI